MKPVSNDGSNSKGQAIYLIPFLIAFSLLIPPAGADVPCLTCRSLQGLPDQVKGLLDPDQTRMNDLGNLTPADIGNLLDLSQRNRSDLENLSRFNLTGLLDEDQGDMNYPVMFLEMEILLAEQEAEKKLSRIKLPPELQSLPPGEYSLLDHLTYLPQERDQRGGCEDHCGNCWVWANTGALELDMAYRKNISDRLSIQYFNSNYHNATGIWACCGGTSAWFADFYTRTGRAIPWSNVNASFQDGCSHCEEFSASVPAKAIAAEPHYDLQSVSALVVPTHLDEPGASVANETAINNIKGTLRFHKGVIFLYALDDWEPFMQFWNNTPEETVWTPQLGRSYSGGESPGAHATLCVGYNDIDPQNRYWIVLNSWGGPENRKHGLFRVNMDLNYSQRYEEGIYAYNWYALDVKYPEESPAKDI